MKGACNALGRRYSRTSGGTTTRFFYGPLGILAEKQGSTFTSAYAHGNALIRKDGEYPMYDGLGSTRTITNSGQTVTATAITEGFGQTVVTTGSTANPYGFAGTSRYRSDGDAGLMHVGARYYDAQVGRFIARDTYLGQHPYLYCEHDPVNRVDPSGHNWKAIIVAAVDLISTAVTGPNPLPGKGFIPPVEFPAPITSPPPPWWNGGRVPLPPNTRIAPMPGGGIAAGGAGGTLIVGAATLWAGKGVVEAYKGRVESYMAWIDEG